MALNVVEAVSQVPSPVGAPAASPSPVVAVDAMGGDRAPHEVVAGARLAAAAGLSVLLVGQEPVVVPLMEGADLDFLHADHIDLEQPLRDLIVPELPIVPLCDPECRGLCPTCGVDRNETLCECDTAPSDPRWDALRDLEL